MMSKPDLKDLGNMMDFPGYLEVYYPIPKTEISMTQLEALPIAIWMPAGGFMWSQGPSYAKTERPDRWLASQGLNLLYPMLARPAMMKAWMDMNTAVKWWKSSGYDKAYNNGLEVTKNSTDGNGDLNLPLWKADLNNVIGTGSTAGAITALHNVYLTPYKFDFEVLTAGEFTGVTNNFELVPPLNRSFEIIGTVSQTNSDENYFVHAIRNYESIPCLDYSVGNITDNTCDGFINNKTKRISTGTLTAIEERAAQFLDGAVHNSYFTNFYKENGVCNPLYFGFCNSSGIPFDDPLESNLRNVLINFHNQSTSCDKILSFAGAIENLDWLTKATDTPPVAELHHINDTAVAADSSFGFSQIALGNDLKEQLINHAGIGYYFAVGQGYQHAGIAINRALGYGNASFGVNNHNEDNFRLLLQTYPEQGGVGVGDVWQHQIQFNFGGVRYGE
jgi:hypothetical protein